MFVLVAILQFSIIFYINICYVARDLLQWQPYKRMLIAIAPITFPEWQWH
jgi:uncharacterized membrane protein